jgi:hypothetical protein
VYRYIWDLDRMPRWVVWLYPKGHWCHEMDGLPITNNLEDCFCEVGRKSR